MKRSGCDLSFLDGSGSLDACSTLCLAEKGQSDDWHHLEPVHIAKSLHTNSTLLRTYRADLLTEWCALLTYGFSEPRDDHSVRIHQSSDGWLVPFSFWLEVASSVQCFFISRTKE